jgi:hypothetical protein
MEDRVCLYHYYATFQTLQYFFGWQKQKTKMFFWFLKFVIKIPKFNKSSKNQKFCVFEDKILQLATLIWTIDQFVHNWFWIRKILNTKSI